MVSIHTFFKKNSFLLFAVGVLLATSIFVGYKSAKIDLFFSDAISDNILLEVPLKSYDIEIQSIHTHLLKWPVVLAENALGFSPLVHIIFSILLLIAMNAWLGYLIYIFAKRNKLTVAICILLLASIELLTGISANEGTLSMLTIRNIELPLAVTLIMISFRQKKPITVTVAIIALLWAILFVTDQLLLYTTLIGAIAYLIVNSIKQRRFNLSSINNKPFYVSVLLGALMYKLISIAFTKLGIANFYTRSSENITWVDSFSHLINNTFDYTGKIFDVFGAGFFNQQIFTLPIYIINISFLIIAVVISVKFIKNVFKNKENDIYQETIAVLFLMYFFAMLIFTIFIPRELGGRYFAFLPVIALLLLAVKLRDLKLKIKRDKVILVVSIAIIVISALFVYMGSTANDIYYRQKYSSLVERQGNLDLVKNSIREENIGVYIDQDYWRNIVVKYQTQQYLSISIDTPLVYCGSKIVDKQFSRKSWSTPDGSNSAIRVKECDSNNITQVFGKPDRIVKLNKDGSDLLFIYRHDVRNILDLKEYEPNFIKP